MLIALQLALRLQEVLHECSHVYSVPTFSVRYKAVLFPNTFVVSL